MLKHVYLGYWKHLIWLCIKTGIQKRGTECGECYIPGNVVKYSRKCPRTFQRMSQNIPGICRQTFRGVSPNITVPDVSWSSRGNVTKHSGQCCQIFYRMSSNIPKYVDILRNVWGHSLEYLETSTKYNTSGGCFRIHQAL